MARDRFGDWNAPDAVLRAARWAEARREELLAQRSGIAFETVFSAPDNVEFIHRARQAGYDQPGTAPRGRAEAER